MACRRDVIWYHMGNAAAMSTLASSRTAAGPVPGNPFLEGNFSPVEVEMTAFDLPVVGRIPEMLEGRLLRIGPNPLGAVDPQTYH
jgi:carotenoid cleavage dioxygenase-like enzyme